MPSLAELTSLPPTTAEWKPMESPKFTTNQDTKAGQRTPKDIEMKNLSEDASFVYFLYSLVSNSGKIVDMEDWRNIKRNERVHSFVTAKIPKGTFSSPAQLGQMLVERLKIIAPNVTLGYSFEPTINTNSFINIEKEQDKPYCLGIGTDNKYLMNCLGFQNFIDYTVNGKPYYVYFFPATNVRVPTLEEINNIYVYSDIIKYQIVGNQKARLLSVIPITSIPGKMHTYTPSYPTYISLSNNSFDKIKIQLHSGSGKIVEFPDDVGEVMIHLHIRRKKDRFLGI